MTTSWLRPFEENQISGKEAWEEHANGCLIKFLGGSAGMTFPKAAEPRISILVILHNKAALSLLCFAAIEAHVDVSYEVLIVDNASTDQTDNTLDKIGNAYIIRNKRNVGFGEACMQAAAVARGKILLFLNNDALLQPGAVQAAEEALAGSRVGAVGGKILLADGTLQEAGSIIWSDGSAVGYGRGDDPAKAPYNFRRPVDYCSGAFLFTPRHLFLKLGGFEPCYAPAYYEDADYCMKVWAAGYRVMYEPAAVIRHYESATTQGTELARNLMQERRAVFVSRWATALELHHSPSKGSAVLARIASQAAGLRIVYIDDRIPHGYLGSGFGRSRDILDDLIRLGHHVTCVAFAVPFKDLLLEYTDVNQGVELFDYHRSEKPVFWEHVQHADVVWISRPSNQNAFLDALMEKAELKAKLVYDAEAIFVEREAQFVKLKGRRLSSAILESRRHREIALASAADAVTVVSKRDKDTFAASGISNVHVVSVSLRTRPSKSSYPQREGFLFVGAAHSAENPNADSMNYFCREVWPSLSEYTGATLVIAGHGTDRFLGHLRSATVQVVGEVNDLDRVYARARVFVVPTRYSAGIPIKAHEAAAFGVPMVVSGLIGDQLGWNSGSEVLVAKTSEQFALLCGKLYTDEALWRKLRINALTKTICEYNRASFKQRVAGVIESLRLNEGARARE